MTTKRVLKMEKLWAEDDLASARRLGDSYREMWQGERKVNRRLRTQVDRLEREQTVQTGTTVRYYVTMSVDDEPFADFDAKSLDLVNHWVKNMSIESEEAEFVITKSSNVEVNQAGRTQADLERRRSLPVAYGAGFPY